MTNRDEYSPADLLQKHGPLTGAELANLTGAEPLALWRSCSLHRQVRKAVVGKRFLRLDRNVAGYARLSPSIRREFLTYTLLGWQGQEAELAKRRETLTAEIREVSESKRRLAHQVATTILAGLKEQDTFQEHVCFILAGDVVYGMAHRVPRPERSTGRMVQGSDLDIVVITSDDIAPELVKQLDEAILQRKHFLLVNPGYREEIDYLVKNMATVHRQLAFDTFEHMVACKILAEGEFLAGSKKLMEEVQTLLDQHGILDRLAQLEQAAKENRLRAEEELLRAPEADQTRRFLNLFYTTDENDEIY